MAIEFHNIEMSSLVWRSLWGGPWGPRKLCRGKDQKVSETQSSFFFLNKYGNEKILEDISGSLFNRNKTEIERTINCKSGVHFHYEAVSEKQKINKSGELNIINYS